MGVGDGRLRSSGEEGSQASGAMRDADLRGGLLAQEVPVPGNPEDAQQLLYLLLGRAIARCQVAEAAAETIHQVLLGKPPRERSTLGAKAKAVEPQLPDHLQAEYRTLVEARTIWSTGCCSTTADGRASPAGTAPSCIGSSTTPSTTQRRPSIESATC